MSAADIEDVGCPEPAAVVLRILSTRSCCASSVHCCTCGFVLVVVICYSPNCSNVFCVSIEHSLIVLCRYEEEQAEVLTRPQLSSLRVDRLRLALRRWRNRRRFLAHSPFLKTTRLVRI